MASKNADEREEEWKSDGDDSEAEESEAEVDEDSESDFEDDESDEEDSKFPSFRLRGGRSILWLCQEGQIPLARKRFEWLLSKQEQQRTSDSSTSKIDENEETINEEADIDTYAKQLEKEVFQVGRDKNYALHELLMGGTSDRNAHQLALQILNYSKEYPHQQYKMLSAQPPSHQRTALHWATWGNAGMPLLERLVHGYPEALVVRDKKDSGQRTPLEILKRYFSGQSRQQLSLLMATTGNVATPPQPRIDYLEQCTKSWTQHRLRQEVHKCVLHYFVPHSSQQQQPPASTTATLAASNKREMLTPFDKDHRKQTDIKPKAWFILSVLGSLMQREMKPLALHILGYLGKDAKVATKQQQQLKKKRKRGATAQATTTNPRKTKK